MIPEGNVTIGLVVVVFTVATVAVGIVLWVMNRLAAIRDEAASARKELRDDLEEHRAAASKERQGIRDDLTTFKLYVAQNHVSYAALRETEERLIAAIDKLAGRMEAVVARLDKVAIDIAAGRAGAATKKQD